MSPSSLRRLYHFRAKARRYGLGNPVTLARACALRFLHDLSVEDADSLGLLDQPVGSVRDYILGSARTRILGAVPPEAARLDEEDKLRFAARAALAQLPIPETLCVIGRRPDIDPCWTGTVIESPAFLDAYLREVGQVDGICKPAHGGQGWDILPFRAIGGAMAAPAPFDSASAFFSEIASRSYERFCWIIQQRVQPHPELLPLMPGPGLGTVRIHSALTPASKVVLAWPILKIPGIGSLSDNWHGGRRGGFVAPIDMHSGSVGLAVGRAAADARVALFDRHPSTDVQIEGFRMPHWDATLDVVRRAAMAFPELPTLGWDVAISPSGPVLIEANWKFSFVLPQTAFRCGLDREIRAFFASTLATG